VTASDSPFRQALSAKRRAVADARRKLELAEAELRGMEAAAPYVEGSPRSESDVTRIHRHTQGAEADGKIRLKPTWFSIMATLAAEKRQFTLDDLDRVIRQHGLSLTRSAARTQTYNYVQGGLLERLTPGEFSFTEKLLATVQPVAKNEAASPAEEDAA
jgi:hypothetical protein